MTKIFSYKMLCAALLFAVAAIVLSGCNAQKNNTAAARKYTAFITRYNIYYNGDKHFTETLKDMEDKYEDDYSRFVWMHPVEAKADSKAPQPSGNFDRSIQKAQKAIQVRSIKKKPKRKSSKANDPEYKAWLKRDEYNPFIHNAWMMMGRSQYYNGDFLGAASTFFYISKHFTWLPATVTDAKIWQAQSYLGLDWLYEAELIITRIKPEELVNKTLRYQYNFCYADFLIRSKEYEKAIPYLMNAIKDGNGSQKTRLRFLLGQVYAQLGEKQKAYDAFKVAGSSSSATYRTKFNARIKQSEVYSGTNIEPEVKALKRMTRYDRNKEYLDQIYYAIGNLYLSRGDTLHAIENYELAAEKSTRSGIDKAISQITLGTLYFDLRNYEKAQPCYAEAVPLLPDSYPNYALLKKRSDVLDELAVYSQNVNLQDSLLHLSTLSEEEQIKIVDKIIKDLKKKEKEEADAAKREEFKAQQAANGNQLQSSNDRNFSINSDNSWYFYNSTTRASGKTEFQKRWGSRKLEDDWRRRNKATFNTDDFNSSDEESENAEGEDGEKEELDANADSITKAEEAANDPHNREYYLKQIPKTEEEKATANEIIQDGLYNMGVILKDKLEDFSAAEAEFDRLLKEYPDNTYRLDIYYNLYLMYMRQGNEAAANKYKDLIIADFPDSNYGVALMNPNYLENLRNMDKMQQILYDETYENYLANNNEQVHAAYAKMMDEYTLSKIMPKFMFLDALAYVTEQKPEEFNAVLRDLLDRYPSTDITPVASAWLKGMAQGRKLHAGSENMRGMIWDIRLSNDSTLMANDSTALAFEINDDAPQILVLAFATDQVHPNELLYEVARFNFNSFVVKDFDLEMMNFGRLGMLLIKGFENSRELNHYRRVMTSSESFKLPDGVKPIPISQENFEILLQNGRTFDDYFRYLQQQNYMDAQAPILQPEDRETLEEAEEAEKTRIEESFVPDSDVIAPKEPVPAEQPVISNSPPEPAPASATPQTKPKDTPKAPVKTQDPEVEIPTGSEGEDDPLLQ